MTVIQQLRVIAGGKHLIVYREGTGYVLRPYIKDGRKYEDVLFTGTPDQFLQYGKYNMKDRREALIKEAYPLTLNGYSERIQKNEYAERELKKFRRSAEGTNIPGYSITVEGKKRINELISLLDSEKRRNYWMHEFRQYGV